MGRARRVPERTCVGCGETEGKRQLVRIVRTPDGQVALDATGRRNGRGAYVHRDEACFRRAFAGRLPRALRVEPGTAGWDALPQAFTDLLKAPVPRAPMVHRSEVPLPEHLVARGLRGPTRTPSRRAARHAQRPEASANRAAQD